jgi:hypothetical protein
MATVSRGYTFGATETVTNAKLHALVDSGSVSDISNADIASDALIDSSKINFDLADYVTLAGDQTISGTKTFSSTQIFSTPIANSNIAALTQADKVSGSSFYALASCVSGAGKLPPVNLGTGTPSSASFLRGDGLWTNALGRQVFTSSGTFTAPADVSLVFISGVGAGGGGGGIESDQSGIAAGGGGSGESVFRLAYPVTGGNSYTVTLNDGGTAGTNSSTTPTNGGVGGTSVFDTITLAGGLGGIATTASATGNGGAGGGVYGGAGGVAPSDSVEAVVGSSGNVSASQRSRLSDSAVYSDAYVGGNGGTSGQNGSTSGKVQGGGGGNSPFGFGAEGGYWNGSTMIAAVAAGYGGGGAGATIHNNTGPVKVDATAGGKGIIIVEW